MPIFESMRKRRRIGVAALVVSSCILSFSVLSLNGQPLPHAKETLAIQSSFHKVDVAPPPDLRGGHLQGVQLYKETLIVSGSSKAYGYLGLFQKLGEGFTFVGLKKLATDPLNHAGGFQVAENWLAVGVEDPVGKRQSIIQLFDVSSFDDLQQPPIYTLRRRGEYQYSTAGAVALLKREDHFLLAVGTWDCRTIDLYISTNTDPYSEEFAFTKWTTWDSREAIRRKWVDKKYGSYQSLQLSEDTTGVYITGFYRAFNDANRADVYRMNTAADPYTLMQKVASYAVQPTGQVTFRNGAGFATYAGKPSIIAVGGHLFPEMKVQVFPIMGR